LITKYIWAAVSVCTLLSACGSDDPPAGGSYDAIADSIGKPTGTLKEDNVREVAEEFGKVRGLGAQGVRPQSTGSSTSISCGAGGTYDITVDAANQSSAHAVVSYNACCYTADCCFDGKGDTYYSATGGAQFSYCASYDLSYTCGEIGATIAYSGCFNASGVGTYLVAVGSGTYAVSGTYKSGSGTVQIAAANGSWSCSLTPTSGTCSGTSTFSI
jgi:hypothetical protein